MKKFDGIIICTDLDGTLLKNDKTISKNNLSAIEYFKEEGGIFTFVTGRVPTIVTDIYETVNPNAPFGCINGGGLYDHRKQEYLWKGVLPDSALELAEFVDKNLPQIGIQVNTFDTIYFCKENSAMARFREITKTPNITCSYKNINEPVSKILFGDENEKNINALAELLDSHPMADNFDFIRSEETLYEILPKGINKGTAVTKLTQILGKDIRKTIAVGDYNNDISMLNAAKVGIAVSNAVPEVKAVADYITVSNEEHAIARIIDDIDTGVLSV